MKILCIKEADDTAAELYFSSKKYNKDEMIYLSVSEAAEANPLPQADVAVISRSISDAVIRQLLKHLNNMTDLPVLVVDFVSGDAWLFRHFKDTSVSELCARMEAFDNAKTKEIYVQTFGRFVVFCNGSPCVLRGKAKEILAIVISRRGREISNEEIFSTIWKSRPYSNRNMIVYYNALRRLKKALRDQGIQEMLISTSHGQIANTAVFDCDFYDWMAGKNGGDTRFEEEFMADYSWREDFLSDLMSKVR